MPRAQPKQAWAEYLLTVARDPYGPAFWEYSVILRTRRAIHAKVDALLDAPTFDAERTAALAGRDSYADAARYLVAATDHASALPIMLDPHGANTRPWRIAVYFGVVQPDRPKGRAYPPFALDNLRALARTKDRARLALACLGELHDWNAATRAERAAYALARLVAIWRERLK
jgi:hypothetical protein